MDRRSCGHRLARRILRLSHKQDMIGPPSSHASRCAPEDDPNRDNALKRRMPLRSCAQAAAACLAMLGGALLGPRQAAPATPAAPASANTLATDVGGDGSEAVSSTEQGRTPLADTFERKRPPEKLRPGFEGTQFNFNFRTYLFDRHNFDGSKSQSLAIGGWTGLKTGYFFDHVAFGATGYTSQHLAGSVENDGAQLLKPGQLGYTVLGEAYADIRIVDDLNVYAGRKGYDTPYINRNDTRMTPNTFEAVVLQGKVTLGSDDETVKYGAGYFSRIKERNSDVFVPMSVAAGATVDRGVYAAGIIYTKGETSLGVIDYFCPDIINIGYAEAKWEIPFNDRWKPRLAFQLTDQRSVGAGLLTGSGFAGQQYGVKVELPAGNALLTTAYTQTTPGSNMQSPWSGYPGYTSVQVQDFNRAGEGAWLLRGSYEFPWIEGLSAYALWVHGTTPSDPGQYPRDECDLNVQWAPRRGRLKGLSLRVRCAAVDQHGGDAQQSRDFRAILNYAVNF